MYRNKHVEGVRREIEFKKGDSFIIFIHPDASAKFEMSQVAAKLDRANRAKQHIDRLTALLAPGTISAIQYDEQRTDLDAAYLKEKAELSSSTDLNAVEQIQALESRYKEQCEALLIARDGERLSPEDDKRLTLEVEQWVEAASIKPVAAPFLLSVITDWEYEEDEQSKTKVPITLTNILEISDSRLRMIFEDVTGYYRELREQEKKSTEISDDTLQTLTPDKGPSLNGLESSDLPEPTELTLTSSLVGESGNLNAPLRN